MKLPRLVLLALFTSCLLGSRVLAEEEESAVDQQMKVMGRGMKKLSVQLADSAEKDASLEVIARIRKAVAEARNLQPSGAEERQGEEREAYMKTYLQGLEELDEKFATMEKAVADGDAAAAQKAFDDANALKKKYHSELR
ncbi:MAG: cytochrome b562 [Chthoniobacterales bacterium]|jgi:soluble cytochrome b562